MFHCWRWELREYFDYKTVTIKFCDKGGFEKCIKLRFLRKKSADWTNF